MALQIIYDTPCFLGKRRTYVNESSSEASSTDRPEGIEFHRRSRPRVERHFYNESDYDAYNRSPDRDVSPLPSISRSNDDFRQARSVDSGPRRSPALPDIDVAARASQEPDTEIEQPEHEKELNEPFRQLIGERRVPDKVLAPAIQKDVAIRWKETISMGLPKTELALLLAKYPLPLNCPYIEAPKLNNEVRAALDPSTIRRDERIAEKQQKIGAALAALGRGLSIAIRSDTEDSITTFESINNAAMLLTDLQRDETGIRRSLILKNIQCSFKETLKNSKEDEWLFGKNLDEKIKAAKVIQKSSNDLRTTINKQYTPKSGQSKNFRGPPQQNQSTPFNQRRGGQKYSQNRRQFGQNRGRNQKPYQYRPNQQRSNAN